MPVQSSSWRKSTHCGPNQACVEAARLATHVAVRDGKRSDGPVLRLSPAGWLALLSGVRAGDLPGENSPSAAPDRP